MRIGVVNDMVIAVEAIRKVLALAPKHELVWIAHDGLEAVEMCMRDRPDLILMDLIMPRMDGIEATRRIMAHSPCAVLIVTADIETNAGRVFAAMGEGALDAVDTPLLGSVTPELSGCALLAKIDAIARLVGNKSGAERSPNSPLAPPSRPLVVIGASAGGPAALAMILENLPQTFPAAVVIVQHVDARFAPGLVSWLAQHSSLPIKLVSEGDTVVPGTVWVAGTEDHLVFKSKARLGYTSNPVDHIYRPSIDVFFNSVAHVCAGPLIGVLLTGMGSDGAQGLKGLRGLGHHTIAQDQATSAVYGMPKAAAAIQAAAEILPLNRIAPKLAGLLGAQTPNEDL